MFFIRIVALVFVSFWGIAPSNALSDDTFSYPQYLVKNYVERITEGKSEDFYIEMKEILEEKFKLYNGNPMKKLEKALVTEYEDTQCTDAIYKAILDYYLGRQYARQMSDSMGRRESGLLKGNYLWTGTYFECFGASNGKEITGQMCQAIVAGKPNATTMAGLTIGICVPDKCAGPELTGIIQSTFFNDTSGIFVNVLCPESQKYDAPDIIFFTIVGLLGLLVITGTAVELLTFMKLRKKSEENNAKEISVSQKLILSFSIIKNTKNLLNTEQKEGNLECLHGLRFISMTWVILGHSVSSTFGFTDNIIDISNYYVNHGAIQGVANASFSVDTFFFLSGLLVAYLGLREMDKRNGKLNVLLMYLTRYLRLTPVYALAILFYVGLYEKVGFGLIYQPVTHLFAVPCQKYWWTNLLYINNLYPPRMEESCFVASWYLANDMQFYLLSPIFLLLFYRHPKAGLSVVFGTVLGSAAITGALSTYYNVRPDVIDLALLCRYLLGQGTETDSTPPPTLVEDPYFYDIYFKPWCRIGPYVIGMATGYFIHTTKRKIRLNEVFVTLMWVTVAAVDLAIIYGFWGSISQNYIPSVNALSFYNAVARPVWALCLAWLTIACVSGYGGPINGFLSWKVFIPLSRLTYCAYLIHPIVVMYLYLSREYELHFSVNIVIYYFCALLLISYALSFVFSMALEIPVTGIVKTLLTHYKSGKGHSGNSRKSSSRENDIHKEYTGSAKNEKHGVENGIIHANSVDIDCDKL
ncbi:nose resistant to fluoxetine protein 6-like [Styela clava]